MSSSDLRITCQTCPLQLEGTVTVGLEYSPDIPVQTYRVYFRQRWGRSSVQALPEPATMDDVMMSEPLWKATDTTAPHEYWSYEEDVARGICVHAVHNWHISQHYTPGELVVVGAGKRRR